MFNNLWHIKIILYHNKNVNNYARKPADYAICTPRYCDLSFPFRVRGGVPSFFFFFNAEIILANHKLNNADEDLLFFCFGIREREILFLFFFPNPKKAKAKDKPNKRSRKLGVVVEGDGGGMGGGLFAVFTVDK